MKSRYTITGGCGVGTKIDRGFWGQLFEHIMIFNREKIETGGIGRSVSRSKSDEKDNDDS
jgi:hypothetical protein